MVISRRNGLWLAQINARKISGCIGLEREEPLPLPIAQRADDLLLRVVKMVCDVRNAGWKPS